MKRILLLILSIALTNLVLQAQQFSGVLTFTVSNAEAGEDGSIVWKTSNGLHKLDYKVASKEGNGAYQLYFSNNDGAAYMTSEADGKKLIYSIPLSTFTAVNQVSNIFLATKTGNTKSIAGYACEEIVMQSAKGVTICYVAQGTPLKITDFPAVMQTRGVISALVKNKIDGIPLEIVSKNLEDQVVFSQLVTNISSENVLASELKVPEGYEKGN